MRATPLFGRCENARAHECPSHHRRPMARRLSVLPGHPAVRTPNLDRLAADGVLFSRHIAQATPCGPSRASLHTGLYACNHRSITNGTPLDARHRTLASCVRAPAADPVLFGYTDTSADPRPSRRTSVAATYEGVAPGFRVESAARGTRRPISIISPHAAMARLIFQEVYGRARLREPAP